MVWEETYLELEVVVVACGVVYLEVEVIPLTYLLFEVETVWWTWGW